MRPGGAGVQDVAAEVWNTVASAGKEIGYRAADFGNNLLYLGSGGQFGSSNLALSQMSQLQMSGQTTWARATFSAVPLVGSGYNFVAGEDLLTGESLRGLNRAAAGFGLLADVAFVGAGGLKVGRVDYDLGALAQRAGLYARGAWEGLGAPRGSIRVPSLFGAAEDAFEDLARANRFGKMAMQEALEQGVLREVSLRRAGAVGGARSYAGRQAQLRGLLDDPTVSRADRGWIRQELNAIARRQRTSIRVPPGKILAHLRGYPARLGYDYRYTRLEGIDIHKIQHGIEGYR